MRPLFFCGKSELLQNKRNVFTLLSLHFYQQKNMALLLISFFLTIAISFLCSLMESVMLSTTTPYVEQLKNEGRKGASTLDRCKDNMDRSLAAILSLNTIANTFGASIVGVQATAVFGETYYGVVSALLTILILVCSEIIPKSIGTKYWRSVAISIARILSVVIIMMYPIVILLETITKRFSNDKNDNFSREEISALANLGAKEGVFEESENRILQNLLKLNKIKVNDIMTPRTVMVTAQQDTSIRQFLGKEEFLHFSRIPIFDKNIDDSCCYVLRYDLMENLNKEKYDRPLKNFGRKLVVTYQYADVLKTWDILLKNKEQIALVVSEYGGVEGIVTIEDIVEAILGLEIIDERDSNIDMQKIARERWLQRQAKYNFLDTED